MKKFKSLAAIMLSMMMMFMLGLNAIVASAAELSFTVPANDKGNHTYDVYQIFTGTEADDGSLTGIAWGASVTDEGAAIIAALKTNETLAAAIEAIGSEDITASNIAAVLQDNNALANEISDLIAGALDGVDPFISNTQAATGGSTVTFDLPVGYYLIKDAKNSPSVGEGADHNQTASTDYMLKVVTKGGAVELKSDVPSIEKWIIEDEEEVKANTAGMGETITYRLRSYVPNMEGYNKYYFIMNDTMDGGLTLHKDSFKVTIGGDEIDDYYVVLDPEEPEVGVSQSIKIVFKNFIQHIEAAGAEILVEYTAELNKEANLSATEGNVNKVDLTFSNDPNFDYAGNKKPGGDTPDKEYPDEPSDGPDDPRNPSDEKDPTGKTPEDLVKTFTTGIRIKKTDGTGILTGAEFTLTGVSTQKILVKKADAEGNESEEYIEVTEDVVLKGYVRADGTIEFIGLADGTYTITESVVPDGYSKADDITFTISSDPSVTNANWTVTANGKAVSASDDLYDFEVINNKGSELPETGGIGTTLFYVFGGMLATFALAGLAVKRRESF